MFECRKVKCPRPVCSARWKFTWITPLCSDARIHGLHKRVEKQVNVTCLTQRTVVSKLCAASKRSADLFGWKDSPLTRLLFVSNLVNMTARARCASDTTNAALAPPDTAAQSFRCKLPFAAAKCKTRKGVVRRRGRGGHSCFDVLGGEGRHLQAMPVALTQSATAAWQSIQYRICEHLPSLALQQADEGWEETS